jgi:hypothetical protein
MRTKLSNWYEVTACYMKMQSDGSESKTTDMLVVDALSFSEAEKRALKELASQVHGGIDIKNINPAAYKEVLFNEESKGRWYKAKVSFITLDEQSGREKRKSTTYLVQAGTFEDAVTAIHTFMRDNLGDYATATLSETKISEVYEK